MMKLSWRNWYILLVVLAIFAAVVFVGPTLFNADDWLSVVVLVGLILAVVPLAVVNLIQLLRS